MSVYGELSIKRPQASYVFVLVLARPLPESREPGAPQCWPDLQAQLCLQDWAEGPWRLRSCVELGLEESCLAGGAQQDACSIDMRRCLVTTL